MTVTVIGISCVKKVSGSDGLPYMYIVQIQWTKPEIAGCTNRDMASRIKQIMIPVIPKGEHGQN